MRSIRSTPRRCGPGARRWWAKASDHLCTARLPEMKKAARVRRPFLSVSREGQPPFSHFAMKLFFAAPDSGLPSALTALVAHESARHFFMKDVFAAPASALPSLPTALLSQVSCAKAAPPANVAIIAASIMPLIIWLPLPCLQRLKLTSKTRRDQGEYS